MDKDFEIVDGVLVKYKGEEKNVTIPEGVTAIGKEAFYFHDEIERVDMPDTVESIGEYAFANCKRLKVILVSKGLLSIGDFAFRGCERLGSLKLPNGVTSIGKFAIAGCHRIKYLSIPRSVTSIGHLYMPFNKFVSSFEENRPSGGTLARTFLMGECWELKKIRCPKHLEESLVVSEHCEVVFYS